jgi:anti-sigma B factor antagonist
MSDPVLLKLTGRLDTARIGAVETEFYAKAGAITEGATVLIDMREVEFLASLGIRMILSTSKLLTRRKVKVGIINARSENVVEALTVSGISEMIPSFNDEAAAVAGLG